MKVSSGTTTDLSAYGWICSWVIDIGESGIGGVKMPSFKRESSLISAGLSRPTKALSEISHVMSEGTSDCISDKTSEGASDVTLGDTSEGNVRKHMSGVPLEDKSDGTSGQTSDLTSEVVSDETLEGTPDGISDGMSRGT